MLEILRQQQRLDELFDKARNIPDAELQSRWSRYLCVLVSGFLENAVEQCLDVYSQKRSDANVARYVQTRLHGFQNPKMGAILELFGSFNQEWRASLEQATEGQLSDSVNSVVGNRHKIAHGESVSLSMYSMTRYYRDAIKVVDLLQKTCGV